MYFIQLALSLHRFYSMEFMTKKRAKSKKNKQKSKRFVSLKKFVTNKQVHFIIGMIVCFFTIYVSVAVISFFFTGESDQSIVLNLNIKDVLSKKVVVTNWAGLVGAYLADVIVNRWFGVASLFLVILLGSAGVKWMYLRKTNLFKRFIICSLLTIWGSVVLAFIGSRIGDPFFKPGGEHGQMLASLLHDHIGFIGIMLVLITGLILIAVLISSRTVPVLISLFSFGTSKINTGDNTVIDNNPYDDLESDDESDNDEPVLPETQKTSWWQFLFRRKKRSKDEEDEETETDDEIDVIQDIENNPPSNNGAKTKMPFEEEEFVVEVAKGDDEKYVSKQLGVYDPRLDLSHYQFPGTNLLKKYNQSDYQLDMVEQNENQRRIIKTLENFGISIVSIKATVGPTITLYEVVQDPGVRISKIRNLEDDIAQSLSADGIRIIAPMPGKGTIGFEVPNKKPQIVSTESVIASRKFGESSYELPVVLGRTITNDVFMFDLTKMPHLLVAGATGQGKSVGLNVIITSLLFKKHPSELKLVLIDPKMVEFNIYENIERHYLAKLSELDHAIITDYNHVIDTLKSLCKEMDNRYELLKLAHVRNISEYNSKFINRLLNPEKGHNFMPYIVVIIDEFGDLIMTAGKEIEMPIARIAQKARAVGIHMIIATQRPSVNIITGTIKANFPARIAFKVSQMNDSRTILDSPGANKLVGRGDLLFSQGNEMTRVQCAFIHTDEVEEIVTFIGDQAGYETAYVLPEASDENPANGNGAIDLSKRDQMFDDIARYVVTSQQGSTSNIQRRFNIGYNRAGRLMDQFEQAGIVSEPEGSKGRQVLISDLNSLEHILNRLQN